MFAASPETTSYLKHCLIQTGIAFTGLGYRQYAAAAAAAAALCSTPIFEYITDIWAKYKERSGFYFNRKMVQISTYAVGIFKFFFPSPSQRVLQTLKQF
jgi:hypothetical protein